MQRPIFWTVVVSLLLHWFVQTIQFRSLLSKPDTTAETPPPIELTEISPEMIEQLRKRLKETKEMQIAETEDAKSKELDPDSKYLSDRTQKAEKETRSKKTDDFRKKEGTGLSKTKTPKPGYIPPTGEEGRPDESDQVELAAGTEEI